MTEIDMEKTAFLEALLEFGVIREQAAQEIKDLCTASLKLELPFLDYLTVRDLLVTGGYQDDGPITAVLLALFGALREGSLCLSLHENGLYPALKSFLDEMDAEKIAADFLSGVATGRYRELISTDSTEYLPLIVFEDQDQKRLYFQKYFVHENLLKKRMQKLLDAENSLKVSGDRIESILKEVYSPECSLRVEKGGRPLVRDEHQVAAVRLALNSPFSIISGGPGTGKTSLMVTILRCLQRAGIKVEEMVLGAPTGRAAQRMTEMLQRHIHTIRNPSDHDRALLQVKGGTLHKILRYRKRTHDFFYGKSNALPASVIVLDEVSMVDLVMMEKFLQAVDPARTKLILLGDKNQLPSVEAGAVFAEMIPEGNRAERFENHFILLRNGFRAGRMLQELAETVQDGKRPAFSPVSFRDALQMEKDRWAIVPDGGVKAWKECISLWREHHYSRQAGPQGSSYKELIERARKMDLHDPAESSPEKSILEQIFDRAAGARVLSLVRNGRYGCTGINAQITAELGSELESPAWSEKGYFSGALIMITGNDYAKELFNGDVGVVLVDTTGIYRAFFPRFESYIHFPLDLLPPWEFAFSMTVHKSQGSEFENVLLVLPEDENHRLLTREILYTGITRAKKRLIIYGSEGALHAAIQKRIVRQSGLQW